MIRNIGQEWMMIMMMNDEIVTIIIMMMIIITRPTSLSFLCIALEDGWWSYGL